MTDEPQKDDLEDEDDGALEPAEPDGHAEGIPTRTSNQKENRMLTPELTFAALLTAAGAGIAATIVTGFISLIKTAITPIAGWNGAAMAFVLTAVLYVLAAISTSVGTLDAGLNVFIAWLTCATAAVGVHKVLVRPVVDAAKGTE